MTIPNKFTGRSLIGRYAVADIDMRNKTGDRFIPKGSRVKLTHYYRGFDVKMETPDGSGADYDGKSTSLTRVNRKFLTLDVSEESCNE